MKIDLWKIFGSKCRAKLLEKFFLDYYAGGNQGYHMRGLARELDEQINSVKRELDNLEELGVLRSRTELRKKIFTINTNFYLIDEFENIFLKTYNPLDEVKKYFKTQNLLEVVIVNKSIEKKLFEDGKAILDIFMIGEIEREGFSEFLQSIFFDRKVKFAIISTEDFFNRLSYGDKLIHNILREKGNIFIKDTLKVKEKLD
ncbi:hypothetical protein GW846_05170 [Candidatus Gracilibacteria bacterium]|nr:hypothetical protein [Candidatus Gracilibacteria bacterium]